MGLESINFVVKTSQNLIDILTRIKNMHVIKHAEYTYQEKNKFWIDILLKEHNILSIRIVLSNPMEATLAAFIDLITVLFEKDAILYNYESKIEIQQINEISKKVIRLIFEERKMIFNQMYGNITKAIGVDEFYQYINNMDHLEID